MKKWENPVVEELKIEETASGGANWEEPDRNYIQDGLAYTTYDPLSK